MDLRQVVLGFLGFTWWLSPSIAADDMIPIGQVFGDEPAQTRLDSVAWPEHIIHPARILPVNIDGLWGHIAFVRRANRPAVFLDDSPRFPKILVSPRYEWTDYFYTTFIWRQPDHVLWKESDPTHFWMSVVPPDTRIDSDVFADSRDPAQVNRMYPISWARVVSRGQTLFMRLDDGMDHGSAGGNERYFSPRYDYADRFSEGYAVVAHRSASDSTVLRYGLIDAHLRGVGRMEWDAMLRMREGMAGVQRGNRCGFIDKRGELYIDLQYDQVRSFSDGLAVARRVDGAGGVLEYGYIDKTGRYQWSDAGHQFDELFDFHEGFARVRRGRMWGFINKAYDLVVPLELEEARDFANGVAAVRVKDKWGFIDKRPHGVVKPQFDAVSDFEAPEFYTAADHPDGSDNRRGTWTVIVIDGRYGYADRLLKHGVVPQFFDAKPYIRGFGRVGFDPNFGYLDQLGKVVWDPRTPQSSGYISRRRETLPPPMQRRLPPLEQRGRWLGVERVEGLQRVPASPYPDDHAYEHVLPNRQLP